MDAAKEQESSRIIDRGTQVELVIHSPGWAILLEYLQAYKHKSLLAICSAQEWDKVRLEQGKIRAIDYMLQIPKDIIDYMKVEMRKIK